MAVLVGTAGWSLPRAEQAEFPGTGNHLTRYTQRFRAVEINSSFHRSHREATWRESVPADFRFSVKLPKAITHGARLIGATILVDEFIQQVSPLGETLRCILVQLPPNLVFDRDAVTRFFSELHGKTSVAIACEPRHESWFSEEADALLRQLRIARVAADPARVPVAGRPGGCRAFTYYRLHGSPRVYYSSYEATFIASLAKRITADVCESEEVWVIFDNTTLGAATRNALDLAAAVP